MNLFDRLDGRKAIIGMVHLEPLPGTPFYESDSFERVLDGALADAVALHEGGATGCLVQTVDRTYSPRDEADPARVAAMALIVGAIRRATAPEFEIGVQLMRNALRASIAVAKVAGGTFIRAGALVGSTLTADGRMDGEPEAVMRYRRRLEAMDVAVIAEVDSMHFRWLGGEKETGEVARLARYVGADAVSLGHPDEATTLAKIEEVRRATPGTPIMLAGYTNHENAARLLAGADGAFVGSCLEPGGWGSAIDRDLVRAYVEAVYSRG